MQHACKEKILEVGWEGKDCINLDLDRCWCPAFVNVVLTLIFS
jgi:hypothetical protein